MYYRAHLYFIASSFGYVINEAAAKYHIQSIPQNFLIDPSGKIIAKNLRGEDLDTRLNELLGPK